MKTNKQENTRFTREMLLTMSETEIVEFWKDRQQQNRAQGKDFYTKLVDPITDEVIAEIL